MRRSFRSRRNLQGTESNNLLAPNCFGRDFKPLPQCTLDFLAKLLHGYSVCSSRILTVDVPLAKRVAVVLPKITWHPPKRSGAAFKLADEFLVRPLFLRAFHQPPGSVFHPQRVSGCLDERVVERPKVHGKIVRTPPFAQSRSIRPNLPKNRTGHIPTFVPQLSRHASIIKRLPAQNKEEKLTGREEESRPERNPGCRDGPREMSGTVRHGASCRLVQSSSLSRGPLTSCSVLREIDSCCQPAPRRGSIPTGFKYEPHCMLKKIAMRKLHK